MIRGLRLQLDFSGWTWACIRLDQSGRCISLQYFFSVSKLFKTNTLQRMHIYVYIYIWHMYIIYVNIIYIYTLYVYMHIWIISSVIFIGMMYTEMSLSSWPRSASVRSCWQCNLAEVSCGIGHGQSRLKPGRFGKDRNGQWWIWMD